MSPPSPPQQPWWRSPTGVRLWTAAWAILAVLHVTQAVWLSAGAAYPGNLQDGRFNQLVLEHGFQSLRGVYRWSSPGQFYPVPDTLAFSDTEAGTLPVYAAFRSLGCSTERAWQLWFVAIASLNVAAGLGLLRALGVGGHLRGPVVFAAVASAAMVGLTGTHMQMLPLFPLLLAWTQVARWREDRRPRRWLEASGWFAWQFAASPYLAFFGGLASVAVGASYLLAGGRGPSGLAAPARPVASSGWLRPVAVAGIGWGLGLAAAAIYWLGARHGYGRIPNDFAAYTPAPASWFSPSSFQFLAALPPVRQLLPVASPGLFAGFLPWFAVGAGLLIGARRRREPAGRELFALSAGGLLLMAFFTRWSDAWPGAWAFATEVLPSLGAFRACDRVAGLVQVLMLLSAGVLLETWRRRSWRRAPLVATALAVALAVETLAHHQPGTALAVAQARTDAMVAAWRRAGDRPVLAFAAGYTNQPEYTSHLDAWSAALRLGRVTINGYSGGVPASHFRFLFNPTVENARALCARSALAPERVSLVERFAPRADAQLHIKHFEHRPLQALTGFGLQPFDWTLYGRVLQTTLAAVPMCRIPPGTEMSFHVPDSAERIAYAIATGHEIAAVAGPEPGLQVKWLLRTPGGEASEVASARFAGADAAGEAPQPRSFALPPGRDRVLVLQVTGGPDEVPTGISVFIGRLRVQ